MALSSSLSPDDFLPREIYQSQRQERSRQIIELKKNRRVSVGPDINFYFENRETIQFQIQEMIYIEDGGEDQLKDELEAYGTLIPQGQELMATMMIEIPQPQRRQEILSQLGHIEKHVFISINQERVPAQSIDDEVERTTPEGKTSSVHFLKFALTDSQVDHFKKADQVTLGIDHPQYHHQTLLSLSVRKELARDL